MSPLCLVAGLTAFVAYAGETASPVRGPRPPPERGVALGLFSQDETYSYRSLVEEIRDTGANSLLIAWVWWQQDLRANSIAAKPGWSATEAQVLDVAEHARRNGLAVTLLPIVRLIHTASPDEWRGKIAPSDEEAWWRSYGEFISHAAQVAKKGHMRRLSVGSELVSRELMRARWSDLITRLRLSAPELELTYSANWDHFREVTFWDLLDVVSMTAYFELTKEQSPSVDALMRGWQIVRLDISEFAKHLGRNIVFSEIGYPSIEGAARWPWDETRKAPIDLEGQRIAYEAFIRVWSDDANLRGVYWWNWFGFGGPEDASYTPRNKPAAVTLRRWFQAGAP